MSQNIYPLTLAYHIIKDFKENGTEDDWLNLGMCGILELDVLSFWVTKKKRTKEGTWNQKMSGGISQVSQAVDRKEFSRSVC